MLIGLLSANKKSIIYAPGYTEFKNCSEGGLYKDTSEGSKDSSKITFNSDHLEYSVDGDFYGQTVSAPLYAITDFTNYNKIVVEYELTYYYPIGNTKGEFYLAYTPNFYTELFGMKINWNGINCNSFLKNKDITVISKVCQKNIRYVTEYDISNVNGENYIVIGGQGRDKYKIYNIYLE